MSEVHKDKAMSPLESAVYWIEYTIRTRGAKHLRPAAHDLYWYQYLMLDSIALIMATLVFLYKAIPFLYKLLFKYRISISRNELKFYKIKLLPLTNKFSEKPDNEIFSYPLKSAKNCLSFLR